ncbi:MAG: hypothetical protein B7X86_14550 [Sphingobacteriales bacterium 17-39-43]|nr:MAG: hypothetical protein B7Y24_14315 [Sphingobacteriales bacterium 16-39-50]OYZ43622.1 MAG: hypothetical protein B7Y19_09540 [Sphingobacteriales bacterium 24-40-4]OZA22760.1 MAG: hypothetical protein B7X86_14550 [Sphingobacteriales bacterium 17-39-43]
MNRSSESSRVLFSELVSCTIKCKNIFNLVRKAGLLHSIIQKKIRKRCSVPGDKIKGVKLTLK